MRRQAGHIALCLCLTTTPAVGQQTSGAHGQGGQTVAPVAGQGDAIPVESEALDTGELRTRDDDDLASARGLDEQLHLAVRLEWRGRSEENYDLEDAVDADRLESRFLLRSELTWTPTEDFWALAGGRWWTRHRDDDDESPRTDDHASLDELFAFKRDLFLDGLDLQVGRQDFDDEREWLYDEYLDAARLVYRLRGMRAELSASTDRPDRRGDRDDRDREGDNLMLYLSNDDGDRHLAGYLIDRREEPGPPGPTRYYPIHVGLRALGEWIPDNDVWAEFSLLRGYEDNVDLEGYAFDLGTTWSPPAVDPWYVNVGYAFASGDDPGSTETRESFRQTGMQDNNGRLGGVTSFRYYGELFDPELSNLSVWTLGAGVRIAGDSSLDLVWHTYTQDVARGELAESDLDREPNGRSRDLGWEVDLILGSRAFEPWRFELVLATFEPGEAFDEGDAAWLAGVQVRLRF